MIIDLHATSTPSVVKEFNREVKEERPGVPPTIMCAWNPTPSTFMPRAFIDAISLRPASALAPLYSKL